MALEHWDETRGVWRLYRSSAEHSADCERYPYEDIPGRVFLDTNVVNLIVKFAPEIFEDEPIDASLPLERRRNIEALHHIFAVGQRMGWPLYASATTLREVSETPDEELKQSLVQYVLQLINPAGEDADWADELGRKLSESSLVDLPDASDRELLGNAIGLGCDAFVTADFRTILSRRQRLPRLPLRILSPVDWWFQIKPWGGLWL